MKTIWRYWWISQFTGPTKGYWALVSPSWRQFGLAVWSHMNTSILLEIILKGSGSSVFLHTPKVYLSCCWVDALLQPLQLSLCNDNPLTSPCSLNCVVRHRKPSFDGTYRYSILKESEYLYDQTGLQLSLLLTRTQAQNTKQKKSSKEKKSN